MELLDYLWCLSWIIWFVTFVMWFTKFKRYNKNKTTENIISLLNGAILMMGSCLLMCIVLIVKLAI